MSRRAVVAAALALALAVPAPAAAFPSGTPLVGANVHAIWDYGDVVNEPQELEASLDALAAAGATWVRYDVGWASVEYLGPGDRRAWYLMKLEAALRLAHSRGLKVLAVVWCTPWWSAGIDRATWEADPEAVDEYACGLRPQDPGDYESFMRWLSSSYADPADPLLRIDAWELWNEPDHPRFWHSAETRTQRARDYVEYVLAPGYRGVKAGDADAPTLMAGPTSSSAWLEGGVPVGGDRYWLNLVYASGAAGWFDVLATHPYVQVSDAPNLEPEYGGDPGWGDLTIVNTGQVRELMTLYGDGQKPIWFTELGWSSHPNTPLGGEAPRNWELGVTEEEQADYLVRSLELVAANPAWGVENVFWYDDRNGGREQETNGGRQIANYGLQYRDVTPKPALLGLAAYASGCTQAVAAAGVVIGTPFDDVLCGSEGPDLIIGLGGDDVILGMGGDDDLRAGEGADRVFGGPGGDTIDGGAGADHLLGGAGVDRIEAAGDGPDLVSGGWPRQDVCVAGPDDALISCP